MDCIFLAGEQVYVKHEICTENKELLGKSGTVLEYTMMTGLYTVEIDNKEYTFKPDEIARLK